MRSEDDKMKLRRQYGLIGYPLSHSFSPGYFAEKFANEGISDAHYDLYPLEQISDVQELLDGSLSGINVTIPYKEQVIPYLDVLDEEAAAIGAVNTIRFEHGITKGYNTDVYGFEQSLLGACEGHLPERALILGTGGAAKAVQYTLEKHKVQFLSVSRTSGDITYDKLTSEMIAEHRLIVNTTPLGMYPKDDSCPDIDYKSITQEHVLYDLVYNPTQTLFLKQGKDQGAKTKNGLDMLKLQAERSWQIWNVSI